MLKLVDGDNDKVIGEMADNTVVVGLGPSNEVYTFIPRFKDGRPPPPNVVLADQLVLFLRNRENVRQVLTYKPDAPAPKKSSYKGTN
jgi:hypothetical protein